MSPQARTMDWLRKQGYTCGMVERWVERAKRRIDLFGFIDIIAVKDNFAGVWGLQATSSDHHAEHVTKCLEAPMLPVWLRAGAYFHVMSWRKLKTGWTRRGTMFFLAEGNLVTIDYDDKDAIKLTMKTR
jgi:hypothetical protein